VRYTLNLSLKLAKAIDTSVGATSKHTKFKKCRVRHFAAISQTLSEAERVKVLIPSENFLVQVRRGVGALPLGGPHELIDAAARHLRTCRKQHYIARVYTRQLDAL